MTEEYKEKLSHLNDLFRLSRSDKELHIIENAFLEKIAELLGISPVDYRKVKEDGFEFTPSMLESDRLSQLHRLILLAGADRKLDEKEEILLTEFGIKLGFRHLAIIEVLDLMKSHIENPVQPIDMIRIFKKYHN